MVEEGVEANMLTHGMWMVADGSSIVYLFSQKI